MTGSIRARLIRSPPQYHPRHSDVRPRHLSPKQISLSLSYFYQAPEHLFSLSDRQRLGRVEWEFESFIFFLRLNNSRLITN